MINKIILASKSKVRKKILNDNGINCEVLPANIDEDQVKESLLKVKAVMSITFSLFSINKLVLFTVDIL